MTNFFHQLPSFYAERSNSDSILDKKARHWSDGEGGENEKVLGLFIGMNPLYLDNLKKL
ncbi:hypothetical protein [Enterococcus asini]|uniref:hypothetical protein n=1 Tax=Enterococcus asini TaxID=57732 RepID=UPI0012DCBE88|nr:hypothetical protein [Enterococcus asini]